MLALAPALALALALSAAARGDTLILKDGRRIDGTIVRETPKSLFVRDEKGETEYARDQVAGIERGKSVRELYKEKAAAAKTANDFYALGEWALEQRMKAAAKEAFQKAVELQPQHDAANRALGRVPYKGEWLLPEERDRRAAADEEADAKAKGLVRWEDRWVTPQDKANLEKGLVLRDGKWIDPDKEKRDAGLERFEGKWLPRPEAVARTHVAKVGELAGVQLALVLTGDCAIAGVFDEKFLAQIGVRLAAARQWFDAAFLVQPGLRLLGGQLAEFYCFGRDDAPYLATVAHFAGQTDTLPEGWIERAKPSLGFYWCDPFALSSARLAWRNESDIVGHCVHHWGHLLLNRDGYDGRLLPPWYDEALAAITEFRVLAKNAVFCHAPKAKAAPSADTGTAVKREAVVDLDPGTFARGSWRAAVREGLAQNRIPRLERLVQTEFPDLDYASIGAGMGVLDWIEASGPGALARFHEIVHDGQPNPPIRVDPNAKRRNETYDAAFRAATGRTMRQADEEWRAWFLNR